MPLAHKLSLFPVFLAFKDDIQIVVFGVKVLGFHMGAFYG